MTRTVPSADRRTIDQHTYLKWKTGMILWTLRTI